MQTSLSHFRRTFRRTRVKTNATRLPITRMLHCRQHPRCERKDTKFFRRDALLDLLHPNARHPTGVCCHGIVSTILHMRRNSFNDRISRTSRNWRFHTELKMWLTKDVTLPEPVQMSLEKEQGSYVFFNQMAWEKVRVRKADLPLLPIIISPTAPD